MNLEKVNVFPSYQLFFLKYLNTCFWKPGLGACVLKVCLYFALCNTDFEAKQAMNHGLARLISSCFRVNINMFIFLEHLLTSEC